MAKAARAQQLTDKICDLALNAQSEETQVAATLAALDRLDGLPVKTSLNVEAPAGATFEELVQASLAPKSAE